MADAILRLGQFLTVEQMSHISGLHHANAEFLEPCKGFVHLVFDEFSASPRLHVSDEAHAFLLSVAANFIKVEIGIRLQVTDILAFAPTGVPALCQHTAESVFGGEVHIAFHILGRSTVRGTHFPGVVLLVDAPPDAEVATGLKP